MNLVLNTFGTYLHRDGEMFVINIKNEKDENKKREVSARKVRSILITTGAALSTDAIRLAIERNIDIVFMNSFGEPYGRVWHGRPGSTTAIQREQLRLADTERGVGFARSWMTRKLDNQLLFLQEARSRRTRLHSVLTEKIEALSVSRQSIDALTGSTLDDIRGTLIGFEGRAGRTYWEAISLLMPDQFKFDGRSRNPAKDEFNCLLNYAYGVLYSIVERACVIAGIDPYVGFVHTDHYQKKSFVFDLVECYRIWADHAVVSLFSTRKVNMELFDSLQNGLRLNKTGKELLISVFDAYLDEIVQYRGRNIKRRDTVQFDCHHLANEWIGRVDGEDYGNISLDYV
ncbi:CRISPR-associated endonuclease Cas1 [Chromatium okenii]|nr:CRISPR-associated endonuclease Cas1 [Chromatium okenii]